MNLNVESVEEEGDSGSPSPAQHNHHNHASSPTHGSNAKHNNSHFQLRPHPHNASQYRHQHNGGGSEAPSVRAPALKAANWRKSTADLFSTIMTRSQTASEVEDAVEVDESEDRSVIGCWRMVPRRHYSYANRMNDKNIGRINTDDINLSKGEREKELDFLQKQTDYLQKIVTAFQEEQKIRRKMREGFTPTSGSNSSSNSSLDNTNNKTKDGKDLKEKEEDGVDHFAFSMKTDSYKVEYKVEYLCEERNQVLVLALSATTYMVDVSSSSGDMTMVDGNNDMHNMNGSSRWLTSYSQKGTTNHKIHVTNTNSKSSGVDSSLKSISNSSISNMNINYIKCKKYIPIFSNDKIVRRIMEMIHETYIIYRDREESLLNKKSKRKVGIPSSPGILSSGNSTVGHPIQRAVSEGGGMTSGEHSHNEEHNHLPARITPKGNNGHRNSIFNRRFSRRTSVSTSNLVTKLLHSSNSSRKIRVVHVKGNEEEDGGIQKHHKAFLDYFTIETAIDHYAKYLTPKGQLYCGWIGPQKLLCNEDYCFPRIPTIVNNVCLPINRTKQRQVPGKYIVPS